MKINENFFKNIWDISSGTIVVLKLLFQNSLKTFIFFLFYFIRGADIVFFKNNSKANYTI